MYSYCFELGVFTSETVDLKEAFEHLNEERRPPFKTWAQHCIDAGYTPQDVQRFIEIAEHFESRKNQRTLTA